MSAINPPEVAAVIDRMKREILSDIVKGTVPATVASFAELHDYVDANEYGGACEEDGPFGGFSVEQSDFWNECQNAVDAWIKAGGIAASCTCAGCLWDGKCERK